MRELKRHERVAVEAVAERFSASWEQGSGTADAYVKVAGKRIAVDIRILNRRSTRPGKNAKPHLRFDKVATRVIQRLKATFAKIVPAGTTVLVTITAPIRLASKTTASIDEKIRTLLGQRSLGRDEKGPIHGNHVQIRLLLDVSKHAPKLIGFVHNRDTDPVLLLNTTSGMLHLFGAEAGKRIAKPTGGRWLVVISPDEVSCLEAYRYIFTELRIPTALKKILIAFSDGQVGILKG